MLASLEIDESEDITIKDLLVAALQASSDGILVCDEKGNIVYVNDAYECTTGLRRDDIVGENLKILLDKKLFNVAASLSVLEIKTHIHYTSILYWKICFNYCKSDF